MDNRRTIYFTNDKFIWTIENFSTLSPKNKKLYSETFIVRGYPWRILMFPKGNNVNHLSIYLDVEDAPALPRGWIRHAAFSLSVINQIDSRRTVKRETLHLFNARENDWGFTSFMPLSELHDPGKGFLVKDICMIIAEVSIRNFRNENNADEAAGITAPPVSGGQVGQMEVEPQQQEDGGRVVNTVPPLSAQSSTEPVEHTDNPSLSTEVPTIDELMDFRGLGQIENIYVPLLEEVCSQHPSLIECQRKRSRQFIEWAFTALGRVLHFLKIKRVKDMNDEACMDLQNLWEELETFRFDLNWLEPHVQSTIGMKNYLQKEMQLKKLRDNVGALEMEMNGLKAKLAATEADLEIARRDLMQAEEGFEERDVDAEIGYGGL